MLECLGYLESGRHDLLRAYVQRIKADDRPPITFPDVSVETFTSVARVAWKAFRQELRQAGVQYLEQDDQAGGIVLLATEPRHYEGLVIHLTTPHHWLSDDEGKVTVWSPTGKSWTYPMGQWKKALGRLREALGIKVEPRRKFSPRALLRKILSGEYKGRRDVIAALLRAGKPELANAVAYSAFSERSA